MTNVKTDQKKVDLKNIKSIKGNLKRSKDLKEIKSKGNKSIWILKDIQKDKRKGRRTQLRNRLISLFFNVICNPTSKDQEIKDSLNKFNKFGIKELINFDLSKLSYEMICQASKRDKEYNSLYLKDNKEDCYSWKIQLLIKEIKLILS